MYEEKQFSTQELETVQKLKEAYTILKNEIKKVIVGQEKVIDEVLICIFVRGHCLLVGVPGLAKTLLISTLARALSLSFSRIQFTPDLMPADITGTEVIQEDKATGQRSFKFLEGPIFANVILADEINRTPPKTQAALLEAMQEYQVTAGGKKHLLPRPFFVLATQNPIEQEGTYPLPEAQLDRFMFNILVDYPSEKEELEIMKLTTAEYAANVQKVLSAEEILKLQELVRKVPIPDFQLNYAMSFARLTRVPSTDPPEWFHKLKPDKQVQFTKEWNTLKERISWGAGPRASQYIILGAKACAILRGHESVRTEDIRSVVRPVLRHRIITNYAASAQGITPDYIINKLIDLIPNEASPDFVDGRMEKVIR